MRWASGIVSCVILLATALPAASLSPGHLVLGYYVPYDPTSWTSLEEHADQLDIVAAQWASVDACGGISSQDDQTLKQFAHAHGLRVEPSLFTSSGWLDHQVLTDDGARANALRNIVSYTVDEGYDGLDLDFEGAYADDRDAFSAFVGDLAAALHQQGKLLTLAVPAKERDTTTGWAGAFEYATLGAQADLLTVMAYEYRGPFSAPGSVAPFDWVSRVTAFAASQIPSDKLLLGLAFYGYDWNTTSGRSFSVGYPRAAQIASYFQVSPGFDDVQQSLTFSYTADPDDHEPAPVRSAALSHVITAHIASPCDVPPPAQPKPTAEPGLVPDTPQTHEVWVEDAGSVAARVGLAYNYAARGVGVWRLGLEDPQVWSVFAQWRATASRP